MPNPQAEVRVEGSSPKDNLREIADLILTLGRKGVLTVIGVGVPAIYLVVFGPIFRLQAKPINLSHYLENDMLARFLETMLFTAPVFILCSMVFRAARLFSGQPKPVLTSVQRLNSWLLIGFSLCTGAGIMTMGTSQLGWIETLPFAGIDNYGDSYKFMAVPYILALLTSFVIFLMEQQRAVATEPTAYMAKPDCPFVGHPALAQGYQGTQFTASDSRGEFMPDSKERPASDTDGRQDQPSSEIVERP